MDILTVSTFNCRGLKSAMNQVQKLCNNSQIVALQETWLYSNDLDIVKNIHKDFSGFSISSVRDDVDIHRGRPHGGLSFMWSKSLTPFIDIVSYEDDRLLGLSFKHRDKSTLFINVYLPTNVRENVDRYLNYVGKISAIIEESQYENICLLGDFNASPGTDYFVELCTLCSSHDLIMTDVALLPGSSYTHVNQAFLTKSWLDHCLLSENLHLIITDCYIDYDCVQSDHFPVIMKLKLSDIPNSSNEEPVQEDIIRWNFSDIGKRQEYFNKVETRLNILMYKENFFFCSETSCNNNIHKEKISLLYDKISEILIETGKEVFGICRRKFKPVPGWSEYVAEAHSIAREAFLTWRIEGSPREGPAALYMRQTRARFKMALRWCRQQERQLRARALGESMACGNFKEFWDKIKSCSKKNITTPERIEGAVGTRSILELWKDNFEGVLNSVEGEETKRALKAKMENSNFVPVVITVEMVENASKSLTLGKAVGYDGIPGEAYKFAPRILFILLCILFRYFNSHSFIPDILMTVLLIPLLKSIAKDPTLKSNYRPIAIATQASKILEMVILDNIRNSLNTSEYQFGFKPKLGTEMCIYALKNTLDYYYNKNTPIFLCFLDAKAAFDRVNYWKLFEKLHKRKVPTSIIHLLIYWFTTQCFVVRWCNEYSDPFLNKNGLRQGSILSPYLFNIYVDELNIQLAESGIGCHIADKAFNNFSYADDLVILSPSAKGLQMLLGICEEFAIHHDIVFNTTKTVCMIVTPPSLKINGYPIMRLQNDELGFVNEFCYLGHIISHDLSDNADIEQQRRKLSVRGNILLRNFNFCEKGTKIQLFKSYCSSFYGSTLWYNYSQEKIRRLKVCHNDILRQLIGVPRCASASHQFVSNNLRSFNVLRRFNIFSFRERVEQSSCVLLEILTESDAFLSFKLHEEWRNILY